MNHHRDVSCLQESGLSFAMKHLITCRMIISKSLTGAGVRRAKCPFWLCASFFIVNSEIFLIRCAIKVPWSLEQGPTCSMTSNGMTTSSHQKKIGYHTALPLVMVDDCSFCTVASVYANVSGFSPSNE